MALARDAVGELRGEATLVGRLERPFPTLRLGLLLGLSTCLVGPP